MTYPGLKDLETDLTDIPKANPSLLRAKPGLLLVLADPQARARRQKRRSGADPGNPRAVGAHRQRLRPP